MDFSAERQIVYGLQEGDLTKFRLLFEDNFEELYRYVLRRIGNRLETERIVKLTFLDAINQARNTPGEVSYLVWLYSLAKPRVWAYISKNPDEVNNGLDQWKTTLTESEEKTVADARKVFGKMSLEEREILRLKFVEQAADGDVMTILDTDDETIGAKIYRVLKRAHFLMFGEETDPQGGYFSELSVFFEKLRDVEVADLDDVSAFRINLALELDDRAKLGDVAMDVVAKEVSEKTTKNLKMSEKVKLDVGSDDPAKIFVKAVEELREEEDERLLKEQEAFERKERIADFLDRFKVLLVLVPVLLFVLLLGWVLFVIFGPQNLVERGVAVNCNVSITGDMTKQERVTLARNFGQRLCEKFEVRALTVVRDSVDEFSVGVDLINGKQLDYDLIFRNGGWKIQKYVATAN